VEALIKFGYYPYRNKKAVVLHVRQPPFLFSGQLLWHNWRPHRPEELAAEGGKINMGSLNKTRRGTGPGTYEGGPASIVKPIETLHRAVMTCLLWEDQFYIDGQSIADTVQSLIGKVSPEEARLVLSQAKWQNKLRHMPLYLLTLMAKQGWLKKEDVAAVVTRPDDMTELLSLYWKDGKIPLDHQLQKGLALAFGKFDEYQLAKYSRDKAVKLRDVLRLARPKPKDDIQSGLWKRLAQGELETPDTWEVAISACGKDNEKKAAEFTRLITEKEVDGKTGKERNKLGDLAFLRNLRKMKEVGVSEEVIRKSFEERQWGWIIPYQFITAAAYNPLLEDVLEQAMLKCLGEQEPITRKTALLVDVSGSMDAPLSRKSEVNRRDVAISLAVLLREVCGDVKLYTFNNNIREIPPRRGFALRDYILKNFGGGTSMWTAVRNAAKVRRNDVMVVITDEQTMDSGQYADANADHLVIINIASYERGVGYQKGVVHVSGWSDSVISWLREYLKAEREEPANSEKGRN
jgi:hypothetical protein